MILVEIGVLRKTYSALQLDSPCHNPVPPLDLMLCDVIVARTTIICHASNPPLLPNQPKVMDGLARLARKSTKTRLIDRGLGQKVHLEIPSLE